MRIGSALETIFTRNNGRPGNFEKPSKIKKRLAPTWEFMYFAPEDIRWMGRK
jgi:hypothetical protein